MKPVKSLRIMIFIVVLTTFLNGASTDSKRVILLETMTLDGIQQRADSWIAEMARLGYKEGENLDLVRLNAQKDQQQGEKLLREAIAKKKPDLVVSIATWGTKAAREVTKGTDIPLLFFFISDPIGSGITKSVTGTTDENYTGLIISVSRDKKINVIMDTLKDNDKGKKVKIALLGTTYPSSAGDLEKLVKLAENFPDLEFIPITIKQRKLPQGEEAMIKDALNGLNSLKGKADFGWIALGPLPRNHRLSESIIRQSPIPFIYTSALIGAKHGAILAMDTDPVKDGIEAAKISKEILKGKKAGKIPLRLSGYFKYCANIKSSLANGVIIPLHVLELISPDCLYR